MAINECDLLIGVGMRFDDRVTGKVDAFAPKAKIIHVDIDPAEIGKNVRRDVADRRRRQARHCATCSSQIGAGRATASGWRRSRAGSGEIAAARTSAATSKLPAPARDPDDLARSTKGDAYIVTDVGQHQMWAAQHFWYDKPYSFITSGGLGTMGFGVPAGDGRQGRPPERHGLGRSAATAASR